MRIVSEGAALKEAGRIPLNDSERISCIEDLMGSQSRALALKLLKGESIRRDVKNEIVWAERKKAMQEWKSRTGAQWDKNRRAFVIIRDE